VNGINIARKQKFKVMRKIGDTPELDFLTSMMRKNTL
jgi:hypothetical protein